MIGKLTLLIVVSSFMLSSQSNAQSGWASLTKPSPDYNDGVMLLLSDGSVMVKSCHGGIDTLGNLWDRLTPDINGSYINGTWDTLAHTHYTRLYCSSQVLKDGRVYVAGGEYGTGGANGEIFDPIAGTWTITGALPAGYSIWDGNSEMLPDGKVLQAIVSRGSLPNLIFDPATNKYSVGPSSLGNHDESAWVKLADNSILFIDIGSRNSERYIPALNQWVRDDSVPVSLYDPYGFESGAAFLLPDGRAFFLGSLSTTAYYTPSGNASPGTWAAGPAIPDSMGAPDAAAAMMVNGEILCAFSHVPDSAEHFPAPTYFYEFDYLNNTFTRIVAPTGADTLKDASYNIGMLVLPDGNILFSSLKSNRYYVYIPDGRPLAAGKPAIYNVIKVACDTYIATGTLFNGITEGAAYGDDWQMATNYPLVRLVSHSNVYGDYFYYARTYNWNRTGVMTGSLPDTTTFTLPSGILDGTYDLEVVVNGNPSAPYTFTTCTTSGMAQIENADNNNISVYPNPATGQAKILFNSKDGGKYEVRLMDVLGRVINYEAGVANTGENTPLMYLDGIAGGIYTIMVTDRTGVYKTKLVVE